MIVASFMLFSFSYNVRIPRPTNSIACGDDSFLMAVASAQMGGASIPYLLGTEIPNASVREKTQSLGASWNVLWAFATNFSIPYLIDDLAFGVGWIFGGISLLALTFTFFFLPETKVCPVPNPRILTCNRKKRSLTQYRVAHLRRSTPSSKSASILSAPTMCRTPMPSSESAKQRESVARLDETRSPWRPQRRSAFLRR